MHLWLVIVFVFCVGVLHYVYSSCWRHIPFRVHHKEELQKEKLHEHLNLL